MALTASQRIWKAEKDLEAILEEYNNDGDWYGCVSHAAKFLEEALKSDPPGLKGRKDDHKFKVKKQCKKNK